MQNGMNESMIRVRVLPEEATEVAEWAGLMLSELVGHETEAEDGAPVVIRDPERAAELLELLVLCAEEGADPSAGIEPALRLSEADALPASPPAYRSQAEREEVLMAVHFGASALIDLARSHGVNVPGRPARRRFSQI
ncbi:hypothetical protein QWJ34_09425 [Saccharibacillus sp. CPCC 101409]|uniref:hypothetical protein n=1 Tax=Saccharibacillus sp. CPCC 101409 TaxID=3058041 RepID=UPI002671A8CE|nr:hypothetical protein [Saccharibacillus sp. CPCC 101409]MDO3409980.1 hypothetical protein [Saccharibacillus sp. CPCC 101409]